MTYLSAQNSRSRDYVWFFGVFGIWVVFQIIRLYQPDPLRWIAVDYAARLTVLGALAIIPAARAVAYPKPGRTSLGKAALWIFFGVMVDRALHWFVIPFIPYSGIGHYPAPTGALRVFDLVVGLALVAGSEEILYRRCARHILRPLLGEGSLMMLASAVLFTAFHWSVPIPSMVDAFVLGVFFMLSYVRCQALWPVVVTHYIIDVINFL